MGQTFEKPQEILSGDTADWYWQSDKNPWEMKGEPQWAKFEPSQNAMIEQAWLGGKKKVDIGLYNVQFEAMMQINKRDASKVRMIRREAKYQSRVGASISKPITVNEPQGSLVEFLAYLQFSCLDKQPVVNDWILKILGRKHGKLPVYDIQLLVEDTIKGIIEEGIQRNQATHAREFVKELDRLTKREFKFDQYLISAFAGANLTHEISPEEKEKEVQQFRREVIEAALKIYSQETFIFSSMNESLRNNDWLKLKNLRLFGVLLVLLLLEQNSYVSLGKVYRGANIDRDLIESYSPHKTKYFSWHSFTSTSKRKDCAEKFLYPSDEYVPVIFEIQIHQAIAVDISNFSKFPEEKEILLLPGTVYEILETKMVDNIRIISLKTVPHSQLIHSTQNNEPFLKKFEDFSQSEEALILDVEVAARTKLANLCFQSRSLSPSGAIKMAPILKNCSYLFKINLAFNDIGPEGAEALSQALLSTNIKWLSLVDNKIEDRGAIAIANVVATKISLEWIWLQGNLIGPKGAKAIGQAIANRPQDFPLADIGLERNKIGDEGAAEIARGCRRIDSESLDLRINEIGDAGLREIATFAFRTTYFNFCGNKITDEGAINFMGRMKSRCHQLYLAKNPLTDVGIEKILSILPTSSMIIIFLPYYSKKLTSKVKNRSGEEIDISFGKQ